MSSSEYQKALEYLFARTTGGVRFGLDRTLALLDALGNPHVRVPCFHIAGTNGKGSTVAAAAALLERNGLRVATYTSPHLIDFRERIIVGGTPIGEDDVTRFIHDHLDLIERLGATFFEATTAMAFDHIARAEADVAVIETGLGGRLDSTNVVDPLAAVVTSIGLDHTDFLGTSLEAIAAEKAGIFKRKRPAVIAERQSEIRALLETLALKADAEPVRSLGREVAVSEVKVSTAGTTFTVAIGSGPVAMRTGLLGDHQPYNALAAWMALDAAGGRYSVPLKDVGLALQGLTLPGRFQRVGNIIFDVAHNPAGSAVVAETIQALQLGSPITVVLGVLADKDWRAMIATLANVADQIVATMPPTAPIDRRWNLSDVDRFALESRIDVRAVSDFDAALAWATARGGTTVITGSFHTVGDAMSRLQVNPLAR